MTLETTGDGSNTHVATTACGLCGVPLEDQISVGDHIRRCPAARAYRRVHVQEITEEVVQEAIRQEIAADPQLAADGGRPRCDQCGEEIDPEDLRVRIRPDGDHDQLCLECQTTVPHEELYRPADSREGSA